MDGTPQTLFSGSLVGEPSLSFPVTPRPAYPQAHGSLVSRCRMCPGRHFAESTMFILCASVLSAFEIGPPVGEDGEPVEVKREARDDNMIA